MEISSGFHRHNIYKTLVRDKKLHHSVAPGGYGLSGHKIGISEEGTLIRLYLSIRSFVEEFL